MKRERGLAWAAFIIVCTVWGTTYLGIRVAIETIPPLMLTATRFIIAGVIMLIYAKLRGERIPRDPRTLVNLVIIGVLMVGIGNLAVVVAEQWVPSGMAALFVATAPFWMVLLEAFRSGGERIDLRGAIGMLIGFGGVALLVAPSGTSFDGRFLLGAVIIQFGSIAWQLGSLRGKYYLKNVPLMASSALQMLSGGLIVGVIGVAIGEVPRYHVNPRTFAALVYLTVFGSILAYSAYVYALAHLRTTQTSLYAYVNPVIAVIAGWLILDEQLTWRSIVGMVVILAGVALVQTARLPAATIPAAVEEKSAA